MEPVALFAITVITFEKIIYFIFIISVIIEKIFCFKSIEDLCQSNLNYCGSKGFCLVDGAGNLTCTCLSGYSGKQCNFTTSSCLNLCQNGGTCLITYSNNDGYVCNCPVQYRGKTCQSEP